MKGEERRHLYIFLVKISSHCQNLYFMNSSWRLNIDSCCTAAAFYLQDTELSHAKLNAFDYPEQEKALTQTHICLSDLHWLPVIFHCFVQPRLNPNHNLTKIHSALTLEFSVRDSEDRPKCPRFKEMPSLRWIKTYSGPHDAAFTKTRTNRPNRRSVTGIFSDIHQERNLPASLKTPV